MSIDLVINYKGEKQVLRVDERDILAFPNGLVGFPELRRFVLLEDPEEAPICVLHCIDDTAISFLVTDPWYLSPDYQPELTPADLGELGLGSVEEARTLCTLSARGEPTVVTANLLGPIVINAQARVGRQVVLQGSGYSAQHPVLVTEGVETGSAG